MPENRDASDRLYFDLPEDVPLSTYDRILQSLGGLPCGKLDGPGTSYWDYRIRGKILVLHFDSFTGTSLYIEDGSDDELLRQIAEQCIRACGSAGR